MSQGNYPHLREAQRIFWREDCPLSAGARHIAAYLLNRMNEDYDGAFPSVARMVKDTGMGRDSVIRYTTELAEEGTISRIPRRRGMYTYRVSSMDELVTKLDATLADWAKEHWAAKKLTSRESRPVGNSDQSENATVTGRDSRLQPVGIPDTERLSIKGHIKGQNPNGASLNTSEAETDKLVTASKKALPPPPLAKLPQQPKNGLALQQLTVDQGVPWGSPPSGPYRGAVWQTKVGEVFLVQGDIGQEFLASLQRGFDLPDIQQALTQCGPAVAKARRGRITAGMLESIVRQYCDYAKRDRASGRGKGSAYVDYGARDASRNTGRFSDV